MTKPKTIRVRIPCLVDSEGRFCASNFNCDRITPMLSSDSDALRYLNDIWGDLTGARLFWITAELPIPEPAVSVEGKVSEMSSDRDLADFLKRTIEESKHYEPCMSLEVCEEGKAVTLDLDTAANTYHEWIPGEGGDIGLMRDRETKKVMGVRLPLYKTNLAVWTKGPLRINDGFRKDEPQSATSADRAAAEEIANEVLLFGKWTDSLRAEVIELVSGFMAPERARLQYLERESAELARNEETIANQRDELKIEVSRLTAELAAAKRELDAMNATIVGRIAELDAERLHIQAGFTDMTAFDFQRLIEWLKNPERKQAIAAFTSGPARTAASAIEQSGVLSELAVARAEVERLKVDVSLARGFDRKGTGDTSSGWACDCEWSSRIHGDRCPEHGSIGKAIRRL